MGCNLNTYEFKPWGIMNTEGKYLRQDMEGMNS